MDSFLDKVKAIRSLKDIRNLVNKEENKKGEALLKELSESDKIEIMGIHPVSDIDATKQAGLDGKNGSKPETPKHPVQPGGDAKVESEAQIQPGAGTESIKGISFSIDLRPKVIQLPPFKDVSKINIKYPVMPPYAYAHIYWETSNNELMYEIEEPQLTEMERNLLKLIQLGLEEMINVSFIRAKNSNLLMQYLERNVQSILVELGTKVTKETYFRLMYYVYRDSVGLNEIEPLLNDYFIEDIECNGFGFPIYIVHRKYQNMRTNIEFHENQRITDFVEKLAQKSGRYVSYARPLLDGTLPDGSRVNATYTSDVTTRGPTFTIRKFTKEPWTPIHLINSKTATPEVFAFLWLAIEHKFNIMTIGETASGKTTFMNSILHFVPPEARICSIEDTREINIAHDNWLPAVVRTGFGIPSVSGVQYGEITLFDLLRETFRQNPDYVVVGEVRGKETYVLFQGMASGHPSFSTFHANSVETLTRRLETPPINLPPTLVESLDIVCVTSHIKGREQNIRRLIEMDEIIEVKSAVGKAVINKLFLWDPAKDAIQFNGHSHLFKKILDRTGIPESKLMEELKVRTELLRRMAEQNIMDFRVVNEITNNYIKNRDQVLKQFNMLGKGGQKDQKSQRQQEAQQAKQKAAPEMIEPEGENAEHQAAKSQAAKPKTAPQAAMMSRPKPAAGKSAGGMQRKKTTSRNDIKKRPK